MLKVIHRAFFDSSQVAVKLPRKFLTYVDLQLAVPFVFHVAFLCVVGPNPWYHLPILLFGLVSMYRLALLELMPSTPLLLHQRKMTLQLEALRLLVIFLTAEFFARSGVLIQTHAERRCTLLVADCHFASLCWLGWQLYKHGYDCANPPMLTVRAAQASESEK